MSKICYKQDIHKLCTRVLGWGLAIQFKLTLVVFCPSHILRLYYLYTPDTYRSHICHSKNRRKIGTRLCSGFRRKICLWHIISCPRQAIQCIPNNRRLSEPGSSPACPLDGSCLGCRSGNVHTSTIFRSPTILIRSPPPNAPCRFCRDYGCHFFLRNFPGRNFRTFSYRESGLIDLHCRFLWKKRSSKICC